MKALQCPFINTILIAKLTFTGDVGEVCSVDVLESHNMTMSFIPKLTPVTVTKSDLDGHNEQHFSKVCGDNIYLLGDCIHSSYHRRQNLGVRHLAPLSQNLLRGRGILHTNPLLYQTKKKKFKPNNVIYKLELPLLLYYQLSKRSCVPLQ